MPVHNKNIIFRVDAAVHIGTGHLQRCLTLAIELRKTGYYPIFVMIPFDGRFINMVKEHDFEVLSMQKPDNNDIQKDDTGKWLGKSEESDADEFLLITANTTAEWCVVDHYSIGCVWEKKIKKKFKKILVIDDLANREHVCDLLLDQNYWNNYLTRYDWKLNKECIRMLGPKYALLREEFRSYRKMTLVFDRVYSQILINFGGVGNYDLLKKITVVLPYFTDNYNFVVVTGKLSKIQFHDLKKNMDLKNIYFYESSSRMAELMANSDYALGACGSTVWERFCLGLNASLIEIAQNQHELIRTLEDHFLIDNLGSLSNLSSQKIYTFLDGLDLSALKYKNRQSKIMSLVDGKGALRVAAKIKELSHA